MAELLFFVHDHSKDKSLPQTQLVQLLRPGDLIDYHQNGWSWGTQELDHPWFRIIVWDSPVVEELDALKGHMAPSLAMGSQVGAWQFRASRLNATLEKLPADFPVWWADDKRGKPKYLMPSSVLLADTIMAHEPLLVTGPLMK